MQCSDAGNMAVVHAVSGSIWSKTGLQCTLYVSTGKQPLTDAAAGSAGDGLAVGSTDRVSAVSGAAPLSHASIASRPSALHHHSTGATSDGKVPLKHMPDDRHVQIVEASSRNGVLEPTLSQAHMEQHLNNGMELRNGLASWIENARSKLGMHCDVDARQSLDKTTDNRGGPESTSDATSMQPDGIGFQQHSSAVSSSSMTHHVAEGIHRGSDPQQVLTERRDSVASSVFATTQSPRSVAQSLLEDLARMTKAWLTIAFFGLANVTADLLCQTQPCAHLPMYATLHGCCFRYCLVLNLCVWLMQDAQAGRNVIECLLRYLDKGGHWTETSSLRDTAIGITRKVH